MINELKNLDVKGKTIKEVRIRDHLKNFLRNYEKKYEFSHPRFKFKTLFLGLRNGRSSAPKKFLLASKKFKHDLKKEELLVLIQALMKKKLADESRQEKVRILKMMMLQ